MMDVTQKSATLEDLLRRVQSNRVRLAAERASAHAPMIAEAPPRAPSMPALPPRMPAVPAHLAMSPTPVETPRPQSVPPIEKRVTVSSPPPVAISAAPAPMPTAPPPEPRFFESTPIASGDVAYIEGEPPRDWTLATVLHRAFRLAQRT